MKNRSPDFLAFVWFFFWSFGLVLIGIGSGVAFSKPINGFIIIFPGILFLVIAGTAYALNLKFRKERVIEKIPN